MEYWFVDEKSIFTGGVEEENGLQRLPTSQYVGVDNIILSFHGNIGYINFYDKVRDSPNDDPCDSLRANEI